MGAIRQEAGRWVKEANEEAAAARAAAAKAEAEVAELRRKMEERVRAAVLKTQAKERERSAAAVARERQASVAMMGETRKEVEQLRAGHRALQTRVAAAASLQSRERQPPAAPWADKPKQPERRRLPEPEAQSTAPSEAVHDVLREEAVQRGLAKSQPEPQPQPEQEPEPQPRLEPPATQVLAPLSGNLQQGYRNTGPTGDDAIARPLHGPVSHAATMAASPSHDLSRYRSSAIADRKPSAHRSPATVGARDHLI